MMRGHQYDLLDFSYLWTSFQLKEEIIYNKLTGPFIQGHTTYIFTYFSDLLTSSLTVMDYKILQHLNFSNIVLHQCLTII